MKIEAFHATIGYGSKPVLADLSFSVDENDSVCLLGPNGIGKTTLFKSLLGYIPLIGGDIQVEGTSVKSINHKLRASYFAYVPQAKNYSYQFSVEEIVLMGRSLYIGKFSSPSDHDRDVVLRALDTLGIRSFAQKKYSELSGGEQQIVLLARALAQEAKYIIMDEPASNLDFSNQKKLLDTINNLRALNIGVFMATHTPDHALACCNKALLVRHDKKYLFGDVEDVVNSANLSAAYGVAIQVIASQFQEKTIRTCSLI